MKNILQHIVDLRNPSRITLGLRPVPGDSTLTMRDGQDHTPPAPPPIVTGVPPSRSPGKARNNKSKEKFAWRVFIIPNNHPIARPRYAMFMYVIMLITKSNYNNNIICMLQYLFINISYFTTLQFQTIFSSAQTRSLVSSCSPISPSLPTVRSMSDWNWALSLSRLPIRALIGGSLQSTWVTLSAIGNGIHPRHR